MLTNNSNKTRVLLSFGAVFSLEQKKIPELDGDV